MATIDINRPGQRNGTGAIDALHIEEIKSEVQGTMDRISVCAPRISMNSLRGTSILGKHAVGKSGLTRLVAGQQVAPNNKTKFGKMTVQVDVTLLAREQLPLLEELQTSYSARVEIGREQGKAHAKHLDQACIIQAIKAGLSTTNRYQLTGDTGHTGGSQVTMSSATAHLDPALMYAGIVDLITAMRKKDVDPVVDGVVLFVDHDVFAGLSLNELLINSEYKTSEGTSIPTMRLKTHGVEVIPSNNFVGGQNITGHLLSTAANGNAFDGDFTKVLACAFSPKAILAAETIALTTDVFFDKLDKNWNIDSWRSYGMGPADVAFSGVILKP